MRSLASLRPVLARSMQDICNGPAPAVQEPCAAPQELPQASAWESATDAGRARAYTRLDAVARSDALVTEGLPRSAADVQAARERGVSRSALAGWRGRIRGVAVGERLAALLDRPGRGRPRKNEWAGLGADELWRHWSSDYLREEAPDAAAVHRRLMLIASERGWGCPSLRAFTRRTEREIPKAERVRARQGAVAALDLHPYQTRTVAGLKPLEIVNGDGRRHDVIVRFPTGRQGRPVVWMWQDIRTRRILSWRIGETESSDLVRTALHELIVAHGVPERLVVDQTLAASSKFLTGGMSGRKRWRSTGEELLGILALLEIQYSPTAVDTDAGGRGKGRGRSKPVERAFGDLARQVDTHPLLVGAYTGRSTQDRPETHRTNVVALETFATVLTAAVAEHNARPGRRTEAAAGRSFDQVWAEEIKGAAVRRMTQAQASVLLLAAEDVTVNADGTFTLRCGRGARMPVNRYHSPALVERAGQSLVARFDPGELHGAVYLHVRDGRYIGRAECVLPVGFADAGTARRHEAARRDLRRAAERGLRARRDLEELARAHRDLPSPPAPNDPASGVVRLVANGSLPQLPSPNPGSDPVTSAATKTAPSRPRRGVAAALRIIQSQKDSDL